MKKLFWRAAFIIPLLWQTILPAQVCVPSDGIPGPYVCWPYISNISGSLKGFSPDNAPSGFCGDIENNAWFSFSPCASEVTFAIISSNCSKNLGLEAGIFDKDLNLVSNCFSSMGVNLGGQITSNFLVPGEVYYFMIDGFKGDQCDFILTGTEGLSPVGTPVINSQTGYIIGETEVCNGTISHYTAIPPACNIAGNGINCPLPDLSAYYDTVFHWTVPSGATILGSADGDEIEVEWSNGATGTISTTMEIISLNGSCSECAGGIPNYACSNEIFSLEIRAKPPYYNYLPTAYLCEGECFDIGAKTFCESGNYEVTFTATDGCDSIVAVDIFVSKNKVNRLPEKYICESDCIVEAGQVFCNEGEYEIHLNTASGCDSLVVFEIIQLDEPINELAPVSLCEGDCFNIGGQAFCESGNYQVELQTVDGCDSIVKFSIDILEKSESILPLVEICEGDCFEFEGQEFCESGNYQVELQTADGCDSIVKFSIDFLKKSENILPLVEICEGDCYEFEGQEFCESGRFEFYRINRAGCDSLVVLEILKNKTDLTALPRIKLCEGESFEIGGQFFDQPGIDEVIFQNRFGCDSTVMFDLTFRELEVDFPSSIILSPDRPSYQIMPTVDNKKDLKIEWQGFPGSHNALNQFVDTSGIYTLTLTDTILGCSVTKTIEIHQLVRECQTNLFISPSSNCESAPFLCGEFLDGFCAKTDGFKQFTLSGNIQEVIADSIENPKWLRWSPCDTTAIFRLGVKDSEQKKGLEFSVLKTEDCQTYEPFINSKKIKTASVENITVTGLIPGEVYHFLFDGIDNDICDFQIEIIEGISKEPLEWEMVSPPKIIGDPKLCPGVPQTFTLVPPTCRIVNGNCAFAGELMILNPTKIKWNLPPQARPVNNLTSNQIEVLFTEASLMPRGFDYLPDGNLVSDLISVEISTTMQLPDAVICTNEDTCKFTPQLEIEVNHELELLTQIDVCESTNYEFCGEVITESQLKICREDCKTTVRQINVYDPRIEDYGNVRICPGTCYTMPLTKQEICEAGTYTFPITDKCGGTETVTIEFYDREFITVGPTTEFCDPLHANYRISVDILEGVPPYLVDSVPLQNNRILSDWIPSGEPYIFEITDNSVCKSVTYIEGKYECGPFCRSSAGTMDQLTLRVCSDARVRPTHNANFTLDPDDGLEFILHTSPTDELGVILDRSVSGDFAFLSGSMNYDSTYYASAIVGTMVNGSIDLDDPCLSVAEGQPVIFQKTPSIHLSDEIVLDCKNPTLQLSADGIGSTPYNWYFPDGRIIENEDITVKEPGEYSFHALGTNGCSFSKTFTITENKAIPKAEAGDEKTLRCQQKFIELDASGSSSGANFSYKWDTDNGEVLSGSNSLSPRISKEGKYFLLVKNDSNSCEKIDSVLIKRNDLPEHQADFSITTPTCYGMTDGSIEIESIDGGTLPYHISFDGAPFSDLESFRYLQSGTYEVAVRDGFGCIINEKIIIDEPLPVEVDLGDDHFIILGTRVNLTAASSIIPDQIEWWSSLGDEFLDEPNWEVRPPHSSTWFVRVTDKQGCFAEDDIDIIVRESAVFIPSGFSPNNDKQNDSFTVFAGKSVHQILSLRVYSRTGELVFENKNFPPSSEEAGWDGTFKGKRMRPDVYVFVADVEFINGDTKTYRGDITLLR